MRRERRVRRTPIPRCARLAPLRPASQTRPLSRRTIPSVPRFSCLPELPRTRKVSLPPSLVPTTLAPPSSATPVVAACPNSPPRDRRRIRERGAGLPERALEQPEKRTPRLLRCVAVVRVRIGRAPAVHRSFVYFDIRRERRLGERRFERSLRIRLLRVVVGGDRDEEMRL